MAQVNFFKNAESSFSGQPRANIRKIHHISSFSSVIIIPFITLNLQSQALFSFACKHVDIAYFKTTNHSNSILRSIKNMIFVLST